MRPIAPLALLALLLAACSGPAYYLLPPPSAAAKQSSPVGSIVVADIAVPTYVDALEIASLTGPETVDLASFDILIQRQDPPVDVNYHSVTALLALAEQAGVLVANRPNALRSANEKLMALEFPAVSPPTLVTREAAAIRSFLAEHGHIVLKPLDAMGGSSVFQLEAGDLNTEVIIETMIAQGLIMAQRFLPAVREGDRRILLINGIPVDHALLRTPQDNDFRANLAAGGRGTVVPLRARDREIAALVGPTLASRGFWFVGLDVIGEHLTEINVTSPTCAREIDAVCRNDPAGQFLDFLHDLLAERRAVVQP